MAAPSHKVALVTAGSNGLGAAISRVLALEANMSLVINYHSNQNGADTLVKQLTDLTQASSPSPGAAAQGPKFVAVEADVGDREAINHLVRRSIEAMGRLDVVVSNAGWTRMTDFYNLEHAADEDDWDRCFGMNVKSHFFLFEASRPYLEQSEGAFISTASVAGVKPSGSSLALVGKPYSVTKAALVHLCRSLAIIAAPKIRVNSVAPGVMLTDWGRRLPEKTLRSTEERNALRRFVAVEDVAQQVKVFANSKSVTGTNAIIDAGFCL